MWRIAQHARPGVFGTVASVNGTTLTVTSKVGPNNSAGSTYTIDASNATITKNGASAFVSNIVIGDTVMIQGTVSGSNVTATTIRDGTPQQRTPKPKPNPIIQGDGQPIVAGNVTTISDMTLTITNKSNIVYTIDASNAKIEKGNATSSLSNVVVGDSVIVQGTINGTSVIASSIIDQSNAPSNSTNSVPKSHEGFFGGVFNFFKHLFGF